jgi:hypothetical protein
VGSGQDTQVDREDEAVHRDAFGFFVQVANQIDLSTIIIVRCEAKFPVTKPDILETSEFF